MSLFVWIEHKPVCTALKEVSWNVQSHDSTNIGLMLTRQQIRYEHADQTFHFAMNRLSHDMINFLVIQTI